MIKETDFQTYLYINTTQYIIYVTDNKTNEKIYSERLAIEENSTELKFRKMDEFLDSNILKIEKKLDSFIKDIYVILDSKEFHSIKLSIKKDNNGNLINSDTLIHPLNDLKNLCQSNLQNEKIIHFLIEKYVIDNKTNEKIYSEKLAIEENSIEFKFRKMDEFLDSNILKIEKKLDSFIKDIYVILDSKEFHSIKLSIKKDNNGNLINSDALIHPLSDLKNLCQSNLFNKKIIHFFIEKYVIDNKFYTSLPENVNCNHFSLDTEFICLSNNLIENIEKILKKYHISLNQILSASYLEKFKDNTDNTIFTTASRIISAHNSNEVLLIGKANKKQGFFERFFNFFN